RSSPPGAGAPRGRHAGGRRLVGGARRDGAPARSAVVADRLAPRPAAGRRGRHEWRTTGPRRGAPAGGLEPDPARPAHAPYLGRGRERPPRLPRSQRAVAPDDLRRPRGLAAPG